MPASFNPKDSRINIPRSKGSRLSTQTISVPVAALHSKASKPSGQETQLLYGHHFDVYDIKKGWAWGQARSPIKGAKQKGYVGFVSLRNLTDDKIRANHIVTALKAPIFTQADIKSHSVQSLPLGAHVTGQGRDKRFLELVSGGYVHRLYVRKIGTKPEIKDYVGIAESHLGLPYIWGGISSDGLDCSGLVLSSLRAVGRDAPRDADMMEASLGENLAIRQRGLKRGDLVFWKGHVGIMQSPTRMIHANAFHMRVESEPLGEAARRIAKSGGGPITAIKRL